MTEVADVDTDGSGSTAGNAYDGVGNQTSVTDATGATTYTYYDALGRIIATAEPARLSSGANGTATSSSRSWLMHPRCG